MTTINNKIVANTEVLSTKESVFITAKAITALVGLVPLAIRATGNTIDGIDNRYLEGTLKSSSNKDLLLGQSALHDLAITKATDGISYAKDWLDLGADKKETKAEEDSTTTTTGKRRGRATI